MLNAAKGIPVARRFIAIVMPVTLHRASAFAIFNIK